MTRPALRSIVYCMLLLALALSAIRPAHATTADPAAPGPHAVAYRDVTVSAAGRSYSARVWYPGTTGGADAPVAAGRHPALSFGHGFLQNISKYESLLRHWASWGLIAVAPKTQGGLLPSHSAFADDLNAGLTWLTAQSATPGTHFANAVDTGHLAVSGHSMGGGAALLAASRNPSITTVTTLAAAETNPSAVAASSALTVPVQYVAGSRDSVAGVEQHQRRMYTSKPSATQLRIIAGGFHCGFTDSGGLGCDSGAISRAEQQRLTRAITTAWLLYTLDVDPSLRDLVWGDAAQNMPGVSYEAKP
ncbi:alpha/beta hydrolase family protein [Streptomyces sp. NPDC003635]